MIKPVKQSDIYEFLISQNIATSLLVGEVLKKTIELERLIKQEQVDSESIENEVTQIGARVAEIANAHAAKVISELQP